MYRYSRHIVQDMYQAQHLHQDMGKIPATPALSFHISSSVVFTVLRLYTQNYHTHIGKTRGQLVRRIILTAALSQFFQLDKPSKYSVLENQYKAPCVAGACLPIADPKNIINRRAVPGMDSNS